MSLRIVAFIQCYNNVQNGYLRRCLVVGDRSGLGKPLESLSQLPAAGRVLPLGHRLPRLEVGRVSFQLREQIDQMVHKNFRKFVPLIADYARAKEAHLYQHWLQDFKEIVASPQ